jgi:hypothetical protein
MSAICGICNGPTDDQQRCANATCVANPHRCCGVTLNIMGLPCTLSRGHTGPHLDQAGNIVDVCAPAGFVAHDPVNHPVHYTSSPAKCSACGHPIECIDVVEHMGFNIGNATKYAWRAGKKGDAITDLRKSIWYLQREIANLEKDNGV